MNNYFDFLEQSSTPAPTESAPVSDNCEDATLTVRVDADCDVICDGDLLMTVKANQVSKQKISIGQHLIQFVSNEVPAAIVEQIFDCQENGKNYIIIVDTLEKKVDAVKQEVEDRRQSDIKKSFDKIDFIAKYVDEKKRGELKEEIDANQIPVLLKNEITPAVDFGSPGAHYVMYLILKDGIGVQKDFETAITRLRYAAENGVAWAQNKLGNHYHDGLWGKSDYGESIKWYAKAAAQGLANAEANLGRNYYFGEGVPCDYEQAVRWLSIAAEKGIANAQNLLGECYYYGDGVEENELKAVEWYTKSAEQGNMYAQHNLGCCYLYGDGVFADNKKAYDWFLKSAEQGYDEAQYMLGNMFAKFLEDNPLGGWGEFCGISEFDLMDEACKWLQKAVNQNHVEAKCALGLLEYELILDPENGIELLKSAAESGSSDAVEILKRLGVDNEN